MLSSNNHIAVPTVSVSDLKKGFTKIKNYFSNAHENVVENIIEHLIRGNISSTAAA